MSQAVADATIGGFLGPLENKEVGCFIVDPPSGYAKPGKNQDWLDSVWSLDDTIRVIALANKAYPCAKVVLYSWYGMDKLQGALAQDVPAVAVSRFVVIKVGMPFLFMLTVSGSY